MIFDTRLWEKASCSKKDRKRVVPLIGTIVRLAEKSRREGLLAVEDDISSMESRFMRAGLRLVLNGYDPDIVTDILLTRIQAGGFSGRELLERMVMMEGALCIQQGYSPSVVKERLFAYLGEEFDEDEPDVRQTPVSFPEPEIEISPAARPVADEACTMKLRSILLANRRVTAEESVSESEVRQLAEAVRGASAGARSFADLIHSLPEDTAKLILDGFRKYEPGLYEQIEKERFTFEDLVWLDQTAIERIIRELDAVDLGLALRGAGSEVRKKIFSGMSTRAAEMLREDMGFMGPVRTEDIAAAQEKIVKVARKLEETGDIIIQRPTELVV